MNNKNSRKIFMRFPKTQLGLDHKGVEEEIEEKKSATNLDINMVIDSGSDNEEKDKSKEDNQKEDKIKSNMKTKKKKGKEAKIETQTPFEDYVLTSKEEEYLSNYLKFNYYLENQKIKHINENSIQLEEVKVEDLPNEASLLNQIRELDKEMIPRNTKYFFNSIELSSMDFNKKRKKVQVSLQNMSIKQNDMKILGNEKILKGDFKEMPETIDSVLNKKKKNMQENISKKQAQQLKIDNKASIFEGLKSALYPNSTSNPKETSTGTGGKDECIII